MAALVKAIEQKRFKQAKLLLQLGDNVNQQEKLSGKTPLLAVCFLEDEKLACRITKVLLDRGANVCVQDAQGMSPLMQACKLGKEKLAKVLIQSEECDLGATDVTGNTALIYSVDAGNSCITKALTDAMNTYDVRAADKANKKGETPLIRAMKLKQDACREVLLRDGKASPNARDFDMQLNAKEWELYLNEKEKEKIDEAKNEDIKDDEANPLSDSLNRKQNKYHYGRSRPSSIINCRQNLTDMVKPERRSVTFSPDSKEIKTNGFFRRRTKSALMVRDKHELLSRAGTFHSEPRNSEACVSKSSFPEKKPNVCFVYSDGKTSKQNGMVTGVGSYKKRDNSFTVQGGRWASAKETLHVVTEQQQMTSPSNEKSASCRPSQLPRLFALMTEQATNSFRSSAKTRTAQEPGSQEKSRRGRESSKRGHLWRSSTDTNRRWSTAVRSLYTLSRFPLLYSRSDFTALNPENPPMFEKPSVNRRRSSMQSTTEEFFPNSRNAKREAKAATISPSAAKLDLVQQSLSLPDRSTKSRIKSTKPRAVRHNSVPFHSSGSLPSGFSGTSTATPVIEETEEGVDNES